MITAIRLPTTGAKNKTSNNGRLKKEKELDHIEEDLVESNILYCKVFQYLWHKGN